MSATRTNSGETIDVRSQGVAETESPPRQTSGEIVVQCLEGEVAITASAKTRNLHAGEVLYLSAGELHSVNGAEKASLLLSIPEPEPIGSEENETTYARGVLLSVMQTLFLSIALALLFLVAAGNIFAGVLVVAVVLTIFGLMHYWVWGRWMSPPLAPPRTPSSVSHR